jgi:thioredoxin 1
MSLETTDATFKTDVLDSKIPVLVDFWAPWCGPCKLVGPIIEQVSIKSAGKAKVYKLNIDENKVVTEKYEVTAIPTIIIFKNGQAVTTLVGVRQEQVYIDALVNE